MSAKKTDDKTNKHLKLSIGSLLQERAMSRYEFAELTGMDYTTVGDLVNANYKRIGIDTLERICKALNVEVGDLFVWE